MKTIVNMAFGSHVYGTNVPESDIDLKTIYIPSGRDILLGNADKVFNNQKGIYDHEFIPLKKFIYDAINGQTYTLDMLFTPEEHVKVSTKEWDFIIENRGKLLSRNVKPMVGYAKAQATKYNLKGSRLNAVEDLLFLLKNADTAMYKVLGDLELAIKIHLLNDFIKIVEVLDADGEKFHLEVIGKKFPFTAKIDYVVDQLERIKGKYGNRAQDAALFDGKDWKALYHAVRVGDQAGELILTGKITMPRPNANELLSIRKGEKDFNYVQNILNMNERCIREWEKETKLPEKIDKEFWNNFIYEVYRNEVIRDGAD